MINLKKILVGLICVFLLFQTFLANQADKENWKELYDLSFDHVRNGEYDQAIKCLEKAREIEPNNPVIYWRLTFVFGFKVEYGRNSKEDIKKLKEMFSQVFNNGIVLCDSNSINPEILFYLGGLYGNRVLFKQALRQKGRSTLKDMGESRKHLRKIKQTEDFYYEARSYLGIFNYWPIVMSGIQKVVVMGAGYKWDLKQGFQQIKDSINYGKYGDDIEFLYRGILQNIIKKGKSEHRIPETIELTQDLLKKYPRNLKLKLDLIDLHEKKGDLIKAKEMGDEFYQELLLLLKNNECFEIFYIKYLYSRLAGIRSEIKRDIEKKEK